MTRRRTMNARTRREFVDVAKWLLAGVGPRDRDDLPAEFSAALDWLALPDDDAEKIESGPPGLRDAGDVARATEQIEWLLCSELEWLVESAVESSADYHVLRRVVNLELAKAHRADRAGRPRLLPGRLTEALAAIALDMHEGNIPEPPPRRGRPRGVGGRRDAQWDQKLALVVHLVAQEMRRHGYSGGAVVSEDDPVRRQRSAAGIVLDAARECGIAIVYDRIRRAWRRHKARLSS